MKQMEAIMGDANLDSNLIYDAKDFLIQRLDNSYKRLVNELGSIHSPYNEHNNLKLTLSQDDLQLSGFIGGYMRIPLYILNQFDEKVNKKIQYFVELHFDPNELKTETPIKQLFFALSQKILNYGFKFIADNRIEYITVRFENGCFDSQISHWHMDTSHMPPFYTAITTSYSTIKNWATRILDPKYFNNFMAPISYGMFQGSDADIEEVELLAIDAQSGYLFNATKLLHRAPRETELARQITPNDYRLFFRFNIQIQDCK